MQTEIEATFLEVDHDAIRKRLARLGGVRVHEMFDMKRTVYDYDDFRLDKKAAWVRVRQEQNKTTMTFKQRLSEKIDGMKEIEIDVSDYEATCKILEEIGLVQKATQETRRETWSYKNCEIMLDEWPWIPPIVEIEGRSEKEVREVSSDLGFDYEQAVFDSTDGIYQKYFDVTRTEISTVPIVFNKVPQWLEDRRK